MYGIRSGSDIGRPHWRNLARSLGEQLDNGGGDSQQPSVRRSRLRDHGQYREGANQVLYEATQRKRVAAERGCREIIDDPSGVAGASENLRVVDEALLGHLQLAAQAPIAGLAKVRRSVLGRLGPGNLLPPVLRMLQRLQSTRLSFWGQVTTLARPAHNC